MLPFKNLSGDPGQDYFAAGLTEEVRAALAANDGLQVAAATSSAKARDSEASATAIARELGVAYLLEGSVQRASDIVRIATSLTDGETGFTRWSQSIDRKLTDIFAVQSEIARNVSQALHIRIATDAPRRAGRATSPPMRISCAGARSTIWPRTRRPTAPRCAHFDLAIAADDGFAMAHAARSRSLSSIAAEYAKAEELKPLYAASIAAARRALELAPDLAEANLALGYALFTGTLDVAGARPFYDRAYRARPRQCQHRPALRAILLARRARRGGARGDRPGDRARSAQRAHLSRGGIDRLCRAPLRRGARPARPRGQAQSRHFPCPRRTAAIA